MRIFLTGANGFIGAYLVAALLGEGHQVVAAVRAPKVLARRFPSIEAVRGDFSTDQDPDIWRSRLEGCDAVINCAGVLHGPAAEAVHVQGPVALFDAAIGAGITKIVQISAVSADAAADTDYAATKLAADRAVQGLDADWTILRPSLVYAAGAYGGTALFRAFAALPWAIPLVGDGRQPFQPIHVDDVCQVIIQALTDPTLSRQAIDPVGPETLTLREILVRLRAWLGLPPARLIAIPMPLVRLAVAAGDVLRIGPINSTALKQLEYGNCSDADAFATAVGWQARPMAEMLERYPAQSQDIIDAKGYFLGGLLRVGLALLWFVSGIVGLAAGYDAAGRVMQALSLPGSWAVPTTILSSLFDIALGLVLVSGRWIAAVTAIQVITVVGYTVVLTLAMPALWLDPLGPLLKNLPILIAILAYGAMAVRR